MVEERPEADVHPEVARALRGVLGAPNHGVGLQLDHPRRRGRGVAVRKRRLDDHSHVRKPVLAALEARGLDGCIAHEAHGRAGLGCALRARGHGRRRCGTLGGRGLGSVTHRLERAGKEGERGDEHEVGPRERLRRKAAPRFVPAPRKYDSRMAESPAGTVFPATWEYSPAPESLKVEVPGSTKLFIGGQWVDPHSRRRFPSINPATEATLSQIAEGDAHDVDAAVAAARRA
ncbi:MAG: aldehyde dehydrogenase family protein, partial [bacterium]